MNGDRLLVKANNVDDCDVLSSLLQDSIFHISTPSFHEKKGCLRLLLNRFCWETKEEDVFFRVHSGLYIHHVTAVTVNDNFKKIRQEQYLDLLAMHISSEEVNILFSGDKIMCAKISDTCIHLKDLSDRYPTMVCPGHNITQ
jgi:hypothetical protein